MVFWDFLQNGKIRFGWNWFEIKVWIVLKLLEDENVFAQSDCRIIIWSSISPEGIDQFISHISDIGIVTKESISFRFVSPFSCG